MRSSFYLYALVALSTTTNALNLPSFEGLKGLKQYVFQQTPEQVSEQKPVSFLEKQKSKLDDLKESEHEEVVSAWKFLESKFSPEQLQAKIDEYNNDAMVRSSRLHNKVSENVDQSKWAFTQKRPQSDNKETEDSAGKKMKDTELDPTFAVTSSDKFKNYGLRVKENNPEVLGLDSVKQFTGYLDVEEVGKHFFFWFFESRNDPKNDPVILWLNGGPGCSSATGLFFELGPSSINSTLQPVYNPYSWNSNASVIFLDQPVGVGYSYTEGEDVKNTAAAAKDVYVFLELFFQKFPHFKNNKFHIAGESYAGHYIPKFASEIINQADKSFELSSVLIGNGITDPLVQYKYYQPMGCGKGGYKPVLSEDSCDQMEKDYPKCKALTSICYNVPSALTCVPATLYCEQKLFGPYSDTGLNPYDIRKNCADEGGNCYKEMDYLDDYLNEEFVKLVVGAKVDIFTSCDDVVFRNFILDGDEMKPFQQYVAELLEKGVPVLLYAGDKDYICNWLGNHAWSDELDFTYQEEFSQKPLQPWITADKKIAGEVKNYGIFTFLRVYDAGHMVPFDQPANSLDMVNRWVAGDYSFGH